MLAEILGFFEERICLGVKSLGNVDSDVLDMADSVSLEWVFRMAFFLEPAHLGELFIDDKIGPYLCGGVGDETRGDCIVFSAVKKSYVTPIFYGVFNFYKFHFFDE